MKVWVCGCILHLGHRGSGLGHARGHTVGGTRNHSSHDWVLPRGGLWGAEAAFPAGDGDPRGVVCSRVCGGEGLSAAWTTFPSSGRMGCSVGDGFRAGGWKCPLSWPCVSPPALPSVEFFLQWGLWAWLQRSAVVGSRLPPRVPARFSSRLALLAGKSPSGPRLPCSPLGSCTKGAT